jgi:Family of unknown function (DUF6220)
MNSLTKVYRVLAIVTTLVIILQFFLAGLGAFHDFRTGHRNRFGPHEAVGYTIVILGVLMLVTALAARMGGRAVGIIAFLVILAGPVQVLLAKGGTGHSEIWGALHAFVGALILGFCGTLIRLARKEA